MRLVSGTGNVVWLKEIDNDLDFSLEDVRMRTVFPITADTRFPAISAIAVKQEGASFKFPNYLDIMPDAEPGSPKTLQATIKDFATASQSTPAGQRSAAPVEQTYLDRVKAYVPVEVLAFFLFLNGIVGSEVGTVIDGNLNVDGVVAILSLVVSIAGCIFFIKQTADQENNPSWVINSVMSVFALIVWAYAVGAKSLLALGLGFYPSVAALLLATYTLFSGFVIPRQKYVIKNSDIAVKK